jgi:DNA (cytosine-5)-methyltransferase 1
VCLDLEGEGYEVQSIVIPACAVNAPHRRDRVWIIANSKRSGFDGEAIRLPKREPRQTVPVPSRSDRHAPDAANSGRRQGNPNAGGPCEGAGAAGEWGGPSNRAWDEPWPDVAARTCVRRVHDGVSRRVDRLKALGNAIVPQVAYQILKHIAEIERYENSYVKS